MPLILLLMFAATKYGDIDNDGFYELQGDLTIKDITKSLKLTEEFKVVKDTYGKINGGVSINGKINRKDFGLTLTLLL